MRRVTVHMRYSGSLLLHTPSKMLRVIIFLVIALAAVKGEDQCVSRKFGENRIVCVCNATYCDYVKDPPILKDNQYQTYTSSRDGLRLQHKIFNFSEKPIANATVLLVDSTKRYQTIHGFGGALTDAAAINIRSLSNKTQHQILNSYFGRDGIGYSHVRITIAGCDFSTRPYTYDDTPNDLTLSNFSLVEEDTYKIAYIHHIKQLMAHPEELRIFTASWSAPPWMKTSNDIKWGFLKPEYYQLYADYIQKFFDAYKERGVNIWGMTPGNEPIDGFFPQWTFNSMAWTPYEVSIWSKNNLMPTLSSAGYRDLVYMALDDQRFNLPHYVDLMFQDEKVRKMYSGIAVHWYLDKLFSPLRLNIAQAKYPEKFMLMTEACVGSMPYDVEKVILGSWNRAEEYITDIIENLSHWVTGWIDWNIALDETGGPNWAKNFVDSPIIVNASSDEFYKQPMFYALAHASKFVPRYSHRINLTENDNNENIKTIAFLTPEQRSVVIIVNKGDEPYNVTVQDEHIRNGVMNVMLPKKSFTTMIYNTPPEVSSNK